MLESLVAWVLNNYVGEYFKLNTDQLSIALLQGQVDLENVPLRTTALSKFDIPVQVKCGVIGALQLRIPLAHIRSQPWTLRLRDCVALLGPPSATSQFHDVQTVDKWQQQRCERWLDELETGHKRKLLEQLGIESTEDTIEQNSWWGASLLSSISNNIQVILENAHIRYECPSYNFGVTIQSLTIQTTNSNWRPGFVQSAEGVNIFKKIDITGFSIYWNPDDQQQQSNGVRLVPSYEMLKEELGVPSNDHQFILLPFSLEVRIEQNSSRFPLLRAVPSTPRFKLDIRSQRIELELNKRQIVQIQSLAQDWAQFDRARSHRKWRPIVSVHESPKQWWHFAIGRTLDATRAQRRFFSRAAVLARTRLLNAYARAYRRRLQVCVDVHIDNATGENDENSSLSCPPISHEDIALIKQIEHGLEFTYNVLHCLREAVFQQMLLKCGASKPLHSHDESPFEIVRPDNRLVTPPPTKGSAAQGWYGWITNWFAEGSANLNELKNNGQAAAGDEAVYLSMKPPKLTKHKLDPELKAVERRMEAEILQVLNESWDESTVLRRDNLLAEIALNVAKVFFRFSEEEATDKVKPSAASLNRSGSSEKPSPGATDVLQQLLTFDLSRLCMYNVFSTVSNNSRGQRKTAKLTKSFECDEFDDESLIYGSQQNKRTETRMENKKGTIFEENAKDFMDMDIALHPLLLEGKRRMFSGRRAKQFCVCSTSDLLPNWRCTTELNVSCAPLSIICDECALSGIFEPFTQKMQQRLGEEQQQNEENLLESDVSPTADTVTHQMFVSVAVPELIVELRSQKAAHGYLLNPKIGQEISSTCNLSESDTDFVRSIASSFARGNVHSLLMTFSRRDCQRLSKLELDFDSVLLEDIFQGCPQGFPLLNIDNDETDKAGLANHSKRSSRSCPDLTSCLDLEVGADGHKTTAKDEKCSTEQRHLTAAVEAQLLLGSSVPTSSMVCDHSVKNSNDESLRMPSRECVDQPIRRKMTTASNFNSSTTNPMSRRHSLRFVFVDGINADKHSEQFNCQISGHFNDTEIEIGLNRRTWILLMDFLGLLKLHNCSSTMSGKSGCHSNYRINCELGANRIRLAMNYPENGQRLGLCVLDRPKFTVQTDVNVVDEPIQIWLVVDALRLTDSMPFYSNLYPERLVVVQHATDGSAAAAQPPLRINILKYRTRDPHCLLREFDFSLTAEVNGNVNYLHTHRFFSAFMDFWLQLAELYDKVSFSNSCRTTTDSDHSLMNGLKTRCKLSMDISGGEINLFVPLSQHSTQAIVVECCAVRARNNFCYSSSLRDLFAKHLVNNQCQPMNLMSAENESLLDALGITLRNLRIWHGIFVPKTGAEHHQQNRRKRMERHGFVKCFDAFEGMTLFSKAKQQIVMDKPDFSLTVDVFRNLSSVKQWGCLDYNLGELLIPQPETIPVELLEVPEEIGIGLSEKHLVFTLRIILKKVQFHLLTPISSIRPDVFGKFALLYIRSAKLFYDSFMDAQSEFDFICGGATLEDAREDQKEENMFRKIVQPSGRTFREARTTHSKSTGSSKSGSHSDDKNKKPLLFESHIKMRRDEAPVISLILAKARVILLMDWIETLKAFVLLNADFDVPPGGHHNVSASCSNLEVSKSGVLVRSVDPPHFVFHQQKTSTLLPHSSSDSNNSSRPPQQTGIDGSKFVLKVTLKECDLVALEDAHRKDTFALIAHTTAAIIVNNLADSAQIESQYEIKQLCFYWCVMDSQTDTCTQLTNDTTATATVAFERPSSPPPTSAAAGGGGNAYQQQQNLEHLLCIHQQVVRVELGTLVIRGLLKDFFIAKCVVDKFVEVWDQFHAEDIQFWSKSEQQQLMNSNSRHQPLFPTEMYTTSKSCAAFGGTFQNAKTIMSTKFLVKSDNLCVWLLEEGNKINTTPFLRLNIRDLSIIKAFSRVQVDFGLSIDYYRLRPVPGWEPLLEHCHKFGINLQFTESNKLSVRLKPGIESPIELTLTQPFIERTLDFVPHWNSIRKIVFDSEQSEGLDKLRYLFNQQRNNAVGNETRSKRSAVPSTSASYDMKNDGQQPTHGRTSLTDYETVKKKSNLVIGFHRPLSSTTGLGISLVGTVDEDGEHDGQKQEELCYGRLSGVRLNIVKSKATYRISCHVNSIQVDNQIFGTDRWHFLFCDPSALKDEPVAGLPALAFEMSYTPTELYDVFECFRLKLSNACILLDEQLMWRLVHFVQCVLSRPRVQGDDQQQQEEAAAAAVGREVEGMTTPASSFLDKNCFFGTLQLEVGNISLSVLTVDKSALPPSLRQLKESYNNQIILFNVENALVTLTPFCWLRSFCSVSRLLDTLGNFYLDELKRQKLNIIFAMDAFGNPTAFGNELKEGFQGLIFEGDLAGFAFGLGYGAANSISKLTSSMAQGVGSLTFDEKHEELRRRMRRAKPEQSGPLTHLYGGIKGLGVGVFGGLTAIVKNTVVATQEDGLISGIARGVTTGAIDTVTKPVQGMLDLAEGTASAVKEIVGAPLVRRAHFPDMRLRTSRVCSSLSGLLPSYSAETAEAQQELMRITGTYSLNDENRLLAVVPFLLYTNREGVRVVQRALISLMQCYIVCQVDGQPSTVTHRILFQHLKAVQLANDEQQHRQHSSGASTSAAATQQRFTRVEFVYNPDGRKPAQKSSSSSTLAFQQQQHHHYHHQQRHHHQQQEFTCSDRETAKLFIKQIMRAKALFDRRTTGGKVLQRNAKKLLPIFTI
uniref:Vacuolar protein sorting-associated protein 13D n=1 Tax=Globodera rostochiensis TaxID=31243 RepID=A0A914GVN0_GLORO